MASESAKNNKSETVKIRLMDIDDISQVYHLGETLFTSEEFPVLYRTWDPFEVTHYFTSNPEYCMVAEIDDRIVGFVIGTTVEKEGTAWKKYGYLVWIGVDDRYQRKNLGSRLYRRLEEKFLKDGVRMMIADTEADNKKALSFFKDEGFSLTSNYIWLAKTLRRRNNNTETRKKQGE